MVCHCSDGGGRGGFLLSVVLMVGACASRWYVCDFRKRVYFLVFDRMKYFRVCVCVCVCVFLRF